MIKLKCVGFKKSDWTGNDGAKNYGVKFWFAMPINEDEGKGFNTIDKWFADDLLARNNIKPDLIEYELDFTLSGTGMRLSNIHNIAK